MNIEDVYKIVVMIFTVSNLSAMGLEIHPKETANALKSPRFVLLILAWGWVGGPALAYLLTKILPLSEPHAAGLLLISMAPTAPFYPIMVSKARGDMSSAGAFILVATIGTVVFLPLQVPILIKGLNVEAWALAQPLLTMVLLPLLIGFAIRIYYPPAANRILPSVKKIGAIFLLITAILTGWLYWKEMFSAIGSYAPGAQIILLSLISAGAYLVNFGMKQSQCSAMALGLSTRNIAAVFVAYFGITNPDPEIFVMIVLVVPLALIVSLVAALLFAKLAVKTDMKNTS